jgi:hypothetical protein
MGVGLNMPLKESYSRKDEQKYQGFYRCGYFGKDTIFIRPSDRWQYNPKLPTMAERNPYPIYRTEAPIRHPNTMLFAFLFGSNRDNQVNLKEQLQSSGRLRLVKPTARA